VTSIKFRSNDRCSDLFFYQFQLTWAGAHLLTAAI
jgi:hypothetical protein